MTTTITLSEARRLCEGYGEAVLDEFRKSGLITDKSEALRILSSYRQEAKCLMETAMTNEQEEQARSTYFAILCLIAFVEKCRQRDELEKIAGPDPVFLKTTLAALLLDGPSGDRIRVYGINFGGNEILALRDAVAVEENEHQLEAIWCGLQDIREVPYT